MGSSLVTHTYSKQNTIPSQYSSDTSTQELVPSEVGSNINIEDQSTDTRIGIEEHFEKNATDTRLNYYFIFLRERDTLSLLTFAGFFLAFLLNCKQSCFSEGLSVYVIWHVTWKNPSYLFLMTFMRCRYIILGMWNLFFTPEVKFTLV